MDDILVRIARAVASVQRLRILSSLLQADERTPSALAEDLGLSLELISTHIAKLSVAGLMQRRRSGAHAYCIARSVYGKKTLSGSTMAWLRRILTEPAKTIKYCIPRQVCNTSSAEAISQVHALVFEAATAFTHHRRIQILRRLSNKGPASARVLTAELHMSESALSRHMSKLIRRGYVEAQRTGQEMLYRLTAKPKTPVHAGLLRIAQREWEKAPRTLE